MKTKPLILIAVLFIVVVSVVLSLNPPGKVKKVEIGEKTEEIQLVDVHGSTIRLSDLKGSVVFLNFWATWCGSCVEELPSIEWLSSNLSANPSFRIVTILYKDDIRRASRFMEESGYTFPVYANPGDSAAAEFGITGVPETFIIDKKGTLRERVIGPAFWDSPQSVAAIRALMNEPYP